MGNLSNIIPLSDLQRNAANVLKQLQDNNVPLIIKQRELASAVIIGVEAYKQSEQDKEI